MTAPARPRTLRSALPRPSNPTTTPTAHAGAAHLRVVAGPMFAGKTSQLLDAVERTARAHRNVLLVRPTTDTRTPHVATHTGRGVDPALARYVTTVWADPEGEDGAPVPRVGPAVALVAVDEAQFFPADWLTGWLRVLLRRGLRVVVAGLDLDYRGEPFESMAAALALADEVTKVQAVCVYCGADAHRTQRILRDGATHDPSARVVIGAADTYEARCHACFQPHPTPAG